MVSDSIRIVYCMLTSNAVSYNALSLPLPQVVASLSSSLSKTGRERRDTDVLLLPTAVQLL